MIHLEITPAQGRESVREFAYRVIKENLLNLTLMPGTAISEKEIADILEISRTPVREAFIRLEQESLLDILPQRGTYVSKIDTEQIAEFRFLRVTMEKAVIKLACENFPEEYKKRLQKCLADQQVCVKNRDYDSFFRLDNMMHNIIFTGCGKPHIWHIIKEANLNYIRARVLDLSAKHNEIGLLFTQHKTIIKAIEQSDEKMGINIITQHVNKVISDVHELQKKYKEIFK